MVIIFISFQMRAGDDEQQINYKRSKFTGKYVRGESHSGIIHFVRTQNFPKN